jgi:hypothetical protein
MPGYGLGYGLFGYGLFGYGWGGISIVGMLVKTGSSIGRGLAAGGLLVYFGSIR